MSVIWAHLFFYIYYSLIIRFGMFATLAFHLSHSTEENLKAFHRPMK